MSWKIIRKFLPIIGIALFVYLLIKYDIAKVLYEIENINFFYFGVAILLVGVFFILQTLKWFVIARKQGIKIPFSNAFKVDLIANFYGFVTPSKLGSIIRADYIGKYDGGIGKGLSNFVIDKVLDLSSLFFIGIIFGFVFYNTNIVSISYLMFLSTIFLMMILGSLIFYNKENCRFLLKLIYKKFIPENNKEKARLAFDSFYENMPSIKFLSFVFIINLITWGGNYLVMYFIGKSLGIDAAFVTFLSILPIATLVAQIPITINGLGTRELTMIGLFGIFGVREVKVISMSLLGIFIMSIIPAIFAIIFSIRENKK